MANISRKYRQSIGKAIRDQVPRSSHTDWVRRERDPVALIEASSEGRVPALIPLRYGRMSASPFAFFRGTSLLQAFDLQGSPDTGLATQICGDCHLMNFGVYATPERNLVFDINDFDETHPGPWEWDIKRLAVSAVLAARERGLSDKRAHELVRMLVQTYRIRMASYARMSEIELWCEKIGFDALKRSADDPEIAAWLDQNAAKARKRTHERLLPKITTEVDGTLKLVDNPPVIFHLNNEHSLLPDDDAMRQAADMLDIMQPSYAQYLNTLQDDRRLLLSRYRMVDIAFKVVGVGSVGTRCLVILLMDEHDQPLFLQLKEARESVLASVLPPAPYPHQGQRVVSGQRLMQGTSDFFLGWLVGPTGRHFYVRQLRDMKLSARLETYNAEMFESYLGTCGWTLARAHAKASGLSAEIAGYLGSSDTFDQAIADYALAYADQTEADYALFKQAIADGRLPVQLPDE
ncbi:DUF2252 domain-containing protein [Jeongeupia naejangsanensis]|uniref:DUF2252 domain-containing protein n=1 Tax=Jeongeupia naejangsanensis TaxID=613195 RepID=A0ABS2BLH7_9NEIS|nr:DUF2252 domain-containing protein [Jeongeupia naejangsanensis]MBM3116469.1 DUF2252 domain-containing protein [Jeongeupia naejangsanensis]